MTAPTLVHHFEPRGAARAVFACRDPEVLLAGPAGTGKSRAVLEKIHAMMLANPGARALIVRKTHVSLTSTGLVTFREHVLPEALAAGVVRWYGGAGDKAAGYIYSNGSFVAVGGMDNPTKIMSSEYDVIFAQEATELTPEDWEKCTTRLRNGKISFQQLLADCNPEGPDHWLKLRCDEGRTTMLYAQHTDNPRLFDRSGTPTEKGKLYLDTLERLTGVRRLRLQGGVWAAAEGVIFDEWNPAIHLSDRKVLPSSWRRVWAIDFGFTNPFVWQMWAIDDDNHLWLEKEIYRSQRLVEDHCEQIMDVVTKQDGVTWKYPKPERILADHDAEDRATFERHTGLRTYPATKTVSDGIQAAKARLELRADGTPGTYVLRTALVDRDESVAERGLPLGFTGEVTSYVWEPAPDGKPNKDRPLKLNDHAMDAYRYVCAFLDLRGAPRVRRL